MRILLDDARVRLANQVNLASAFRTSLLLLPEHFTELELYEMIASISYMGDFRMQVGENPLKVRNIVSAQLPQFRRLYGGLVKSFWRSISFTDVSVGPGGVRSMKQDTSVMRRALTTSNLPIGVRAKLLKHFEARNIQDGAVTLVGKSGQDVDMESNTNAVWAKIVADEEFRPVLIKSECSPARRCLT